jgi:hypothetical protein
METIALFLNVSIGTATLISILSIVALCTLAALIYFRKDIANYFKGNEPKERELEKDDLRTELSKELDQDTLEKNLLSFIQKEISDNKTVILPNVLEFHGLGAKDMTI